MSLNKKAFLIPFSLILLLTLLGFLLKDQFHYLYSGILIYLFYLIYLYFKKRGSIQVAHTLEGLVLFVISLHLTLGWYFNLYNKLPWFDNVLHLLGGFSFALFFYSIIKSTTGFNSRSQLFHLLLITLIGLGIGAVFEMIEFMSDSLFYTNHQHSLVDTNWDLIFDLLGSLLAGTYKAFISPW